MPASNVIQTSETAQRYARALFELAQDKGDLATIHKDFRAFAALIKTSADLRKLLDSPAFSRDVKVSALAEIAKKAGYSPLFGKFLGTMATNGRANDILGAEFAFDQFYAKQRGVQRAIVRTAKEMTGAEKSRIESLLARVVGGDVELTSEVDPSLIGGIQLRLGSKLVDASVAKKLERMNTVMKGA
ncbi:ATP synthase F1 subunit delta [Hyphomonas hirschiana VP5]|uniref:ATP synthase subunit delta n=1 Tax=Hyphomonas hirschiana VP5 TaxID=1280951 RepID=A0A059FWF0_9PROT|nr:ATP synthase F1 subunit delta [Hyphomonas hirschiana]KCZ94989.1 ATP synthase F1 subunit delta [Hyphomonas hirschiana VP5]